MKKRTVALFLLITGLLVGQIQIAKGLQETYEWNIPSGVGSYNTYQISVTTSGSWQVATKIDVTVRLTLTSKSSVLDHTEYNKVKITLNTENFIMDSENACNVCKVTLTNIGDVGERTVSFNIPAEKLNRGQTLNASITFVVTIDEIDNIQWESWNHVGQTYGNPMYVSLYRPILSIMELIIVVVVIVIVVGVTGFLLYRRKKVSVKIPSPTLQ